MAKCSLCNFQAQWVLYGYDDDGYPHFRRLGNNFSGKGMAKFCEVHYQHKKREILSRMEQDDYHGEGVA